MLKTRQQPAYKRIVTLLEDPKTLLASLLISNCIVNIGIILISNVLMDQWVGALELHELLNFFIKVVVVTIALVMFGEVLPKVWATHHKIWFASTTSMTVNIFNSVFFRISKRIVVMSDAIQKMFHSGNATINDSQIDYAIDLLPEHEVTSEEKQILKGISKFSNTTVKQAMRTRLDVSGIEISSSFKDVIQKGRLPIHVYRYINIILMK